ncbi:MAG: TonB-dependent receptor [Bacteroidales bacterium]
MDKSVRQESFVISGRLEINNSDSKDPVDEFTNVYPQTQTTQINPGFSLGIQKTFSDRLKTGLWLGRAQRSGSLTERFINYFPVGLDPYEMLGNPKLNPEINNQADLTFTWSSNISAIDIDIFASYMENYISSVINPDLSPRLPMSPGVRQYTNIDKAFKTGFELSWTQKLIASLEHQAGIAYTYAQDLEIDEPLPEVAPLEFVYVVRGDYLKNRLQPEVSFRHAMEQSRISTEYGETTTPSFSLLDLKITFQMSGNIRLTGGVKNLLDENYYEHLSRSVRGTQTPIYAPGRSFFGSINVSF